MQLADLDGVIIEASENALGHQFNIIYASWQLKTVKLRELIQTPYSDSVVI